MDLQLTNMCVLQTLAPQKYIANKKPQIEGALNLELKIRT